MIANFTFYYIIIPLGVILGWFVIGSGTGFSFTPSRVWKDKGDMWVARVVSIALILVGLYGTGWAIDQITSYRPSFRLRVEPATKPHVEIRAEDKDGKVRHGTVEQDGEGRAVIRWTD
jgi:uncharacterized membrane protein